MVAHSFGSLAAVCAASDRPGRISGMMLVAPPDPRKFDVEHLLPQTPLECPSVLVASSDDPWLQLSFAERWAERWGSRLCKLGKAGHINVDSGFGPWPQGLEILRALQDSESALTGEGHLGAPRTSSGRRPEHVEQWLDASREYFKRDLVSAGRVEQREREVVLKCYLGGR